MLSTSANKFLLTIFTEDLFSKADGDRRYAPEFLAGFYAHARKSFAELAHVIIVHYRAHKIEVALQELSPHILADIGVQRGTISAVAYKHAENYSQK